MATVYKARHEALDRVVAIKVLPEFFAETDEYRTRFLEEARSIARLSHPNILDVYDFGEEGGIPYLVLEFVDGGSLADRLGQPMALREALQILKPLASAIDYAHEQGVLHRDINPSNILLRRDGTPLLADFGLARILSSITRTTSPGTVMGTPLYMSPESTSDAEVGPASDHYSLAVVAYQMLTGRLPFEGDTPLAVLMSHLTKPMPPAIELEGELSAHVEAVLDKALSKAPGDRYTTAGHFIEALAPAAWPDYRRRPISDIRRKRAPREAAKREWGGPVSRLPVVLVVDDQAANRELIEACLAELDCEIRLAEDGPTALRLVEAEPPDMVLLDVRMPGMDGYEVCRRIKAGRRGQFLPVVMVTSLSETQDRVMALESGADDFMSKPVNRVELVARVRSALRLKASYNTVDSAEQVIFALAAAVEAKDPFTEKHAERVAVFARYIGSQLGAPENALEALYRGGLIHDIGKIGVPDGVLLKPGPLDPDELAQMRAHPVIGEAIVRPLRSGSSVLPIIRNHHERFDGHGYPDGLRGDGIPLLARIVAVCDAYDALVNDRPYRPRRTVDEAAAILIDGAGTQWDPDVAALFVRELTAIQHLGPEVPAPAVVEPQRSQKGNPTRSI
jgi:putative two-component system response regulator